MKKQKLIQKNNSNLLIPLIFLKYNVLGLLVGLPIYPSQIGQEVIKGVGKKKSLSFLYIIFFLHSYILKILLGINE